MQGNKTNIYMGNIILIKLCAFINNILSVPKMECCLYCVRIIKKLPQYMVNILSFNGENILKINKEIV